MKKKKGTLHLGTLLSVAALLLVSGSTAEALDVQPARLELTIEADQPYRGTIDVSNRSQKAVNVQIATGAYRFFQPGVNVPSAQTWFTFEPEQFSLAPLSSSKVSYLITPPANIRNDTAGEYLAALLIDELPAPQENRQASRITLVPRFALPVYVTIHGRERIDVEISQVSVRAGQSSGLLRVDTTLANHGTVHVRPTGTLALLDAHKEILQAYPLGKALPLLPSATLRIPTAVPLPPVGRYEAIVTVESHSGNVLQKQLSFEVTADGQVH